MAGSIPIVRSAFTSWRDEFSGRGIRPVVFDILHADRETSLLPEDLKLVLHVNPSTMGLSYSKEITRIQTKGGFVEQHWGDSALEITFDLATGGFVRLYTGLSARTGSATINAKGNKSMPPEAAYGRRETIAYDKYLDMLALFHNNGAIYDSNGTIALQGYIKIIFDGGFHYGWFTSFQVTENVDKPYQLAMSAAFVVELEEMVLRSHEITEAFDPLTGTIQNTTPGGGPLLSGLDRFAEAAGTQ